MRMPWFMKWMYLHIIIWVANDLIPIKKVVIGKASKPLKFRLVQKRVINLIAYILQLFQVISLLLACLVNCWLLLQYRAMDHLVPLPMSLNVTSILLLQRALTVTQDMLQGFTVKVQRDINVLYEPHSHAIKIDHFLGRTLHWWCCTAQWFKYSKIW